MDIVERAGALLWGSERPDTILYKKLLGIPQSTRKPPPPSLAHALPFGGLFPRSGKSLWCHAQGLAGAADQNRCSNRKTKVLEDKDFEVCAICDDDSQIPLPKVLIARKASSLRIFC